MTSLLLLVAVATMVPTEWWLDNVRFGDLGGVLGSCLEPVGIMFWGDLALTQLFSNCDTSNVDEADNRGPINRL